MIVLGLRSLLLVLRVLLPHSDVWANDHYVVDQKGLGQEGLEKSHVNVNVVIDYVVVLIARIAKQSTLV